MFKWHIVLRLNQPDVWRVWLGLLSAEHHADLNFSCSKRRVELQWSATAPEHAQHQFTWECTLMQLL